MKNGKTGPKKVEENPLSGLEALLSQFTEFTPTAHKTFELDVDNIQTLEDVKDVLRALQPEFECYSDKMPERFKILFDRNIIKEIKKEEDSPDMPEEVEEQFWAEQPPMPFATEEDLKATTENYYEEGYTD